MLTKLIAAVAISLAALAAAGCKSPCESNTEGAYFCG